MVEGLYLEFKKKLEKKYKIEIDSLTIEDKGGKVVINITPVTQSFTFETKEVAEEDSDEVKEVES